MTSGNLSFLEKLKVEFQHVITPNLLNTLGKSSLTSVETFLESLTSYSAIECLKVRSVVDIKKASLKDIYAALTKCWHNELVSIAELTKPGKDVTQFLTLYMKKHELLELLEALRELSFNQKILTHFSFISDWFLERLTGIESTQHLISVLREYRSVPAIIIADTLMLGSEGSINELDIDFIRASVLEEYWRKLESAAANVEPKVKFNNCLRNLKLIDMLELKVREVLLEGKEISTGLPKLPSKVTEIIEGSDPMEIDFIIAALRYVACVDEMVFSPISHDVTIAYMVAKDYETLLLAPFIKSQTLGLGKYFLNEVLSRWLSAYGKITGK